MTRARQPVPALPLLAGDLSRPLIRRRGGAVDADRFLAEAIALSRCLPDGDVINLCNDRGHFLVAFAAALLAGRVTLLPPSRTQAAIAESRRQHGPAVAITDADVVAAITDARVDPTPTMPLIPADRVVAIGFTSGSTGTPKASAKTWRAFHACTLQNLAVLRPLAPSLNVLATVPSQHMYGMETAVLMPLLGPVAVADARPLFPQDLADALAALPEPRLLVTTPVHLRAFIAAGIGYPAVAGIVSATAPLPVELARAAEDAFAAPLIETFGSTETCIIAHRRTANGEAWRLYPDLDLLDDADGTRVAAAHFPEPIRLHDRLRLLGRRRFVIEGRDQDLIEIAGKRASLGDISTRLLAIPGVLDAAAAQSATADAGGVHRVLAAVVAPGVDDATILAALRASLDPVFLPRPLLRVERLPRNDAGKLCRADLLALFDG